MPRPNFSVTLVGNGAKASNVHLGGTMVPYTFNAIHASETVTGPPRRKRPKGWVDPLPYSLSRYAYRSMYGRYEHIQYDMANGGRVAGHNVWEGWINHVLPPDMFATHTGKFKGMTHIPSAAEVDRAIIKARIKMKRQDINLGVAFAERNRTAQLLGDTASQLARSLMALRKGNWRKSAEILGLRNAKKPRGSSLPQRWLEYQYGWVPLLSDVFGAADALTKRPSGDWVVTGKGYVSSKEERIEDHRNGVNGPNDYKTGVASAKLERGVFVRIDAVPQNDLLMSFSSLGITNPLLVAWELVPFSFVVDWALPIGQYLDSLDAMLGYGPTTCSISEFGKFEGKWVGGKDEFMMFNRYKHVHSNSGSMWLERVHMKRTVSNTVPLPTLPRLRDPRSLTRMANGLSLLATAFSRR